LRGAWCVKNPDPDTQHAPRNTTPIVNDKAETQSRSVKVSQGESRCRPQFFAQPSPLTSRVRRGSVSGQREYPNP